MAAAGYDFATNVISSEGKVFQLEYAAKAVESAGTAIGVRCTDGVIIAAEKLMASKMLVKTSNKVVHKVDEHIGVVFSGVTADGKAVVKMAQNICASYKQNYHERIAPGVLAEQLADVLYAYTSYAAYRPFGVHVMVCGYDDDKRDHELYLCELDGTFTRFFGTAVGKGARTGKTEIQKTRLTTLTCAEALPIIARIIHTVHDSSKDKPFVLEAGWCCAANGFNYSKIPDSILGPANAEGEAAADAAPPEGDVAAAAMLGSASSDA